MMGRSAGLQSARSFPDSINNSGINLTVMIPMQGKSFLETCKMYSLRDWAQIVFISLICLAGGYLIIYSVYMMTVNYEPNLFMFSIAMFGVGCTAIWFGLSHVEIQATEEKLESITTRLDSIMEKIERK